MVARVDVRLERVVGIAERRQREGLGLGESRAAAEHAGRAGERCGAGQEFQGISSVHGFPPRTLLAGSGDGREVPGNGTPSAAQPIWRGGAGSGAPTRGLGLVDAGRARLRASNIRERCIASDRASARPASTFTWSSAGLCRRAPGPRTSSGAGWSRLPAWSKRGPAPASPPMPPIGLLGRGRGARLARRLEADRRARSFRVSPSTASSRSTSAPRPAASRRCCSSAARRASMRSMSGTASCTRGWPPTRASSRSRTATRGGSIAPSCRSPSARSSPT